MQYHFKIVDSVSENSIKDTKDMVPDYITDESFRGYESLKEADEKGREWMLHEKIDSFKFYIKTYSIAENVEEEDILKGMHYFASEMYDEDYDLGVDADYGLDIDDAGEMPSKENKHLGIPKGDMIDDEDEDLDYLNEFNDDRDLFGHNISGDIDSPENIKAEDEWMNEEQHQMLDDFDSND